MAPNAIIGHPSTPMATHYGALDLEGEKTQKGSSLRSGVVVAACLMALMTVGVFALSSGSAPASMSSVVNVLPGVPVPGGPRGSSAGVSDCVCAGACNALGTAAAGFADMDEGLHYCEITSADADADGNQDLCVGIDGNFYQSTTAGAARPTDCTSNNCQAVCDYDVGRYDCWSFPCFNGGFCTDGEDSYTCHCDFGFTGPDCKVNVNECDLVNTDSDADGVADVLKKVCDVNALCEDDYGTYSCACNAGWKGDGYTEDGVLGYDADVWRSNDANGRPPWIARSRQTDDIQACVDIDDCERQPCKNGATCINLLGIENGYECECPVGPTGVPAFVGHDCETDVDECDAANPANYCDSHATCVNVPGTYQCICNEHWQPVDDDGVDREGSMFFISNVLEGSGCYDASDCASGPCQNGGTCSEGPDGCEAKDAEGNTIMVDCYTCTCSYGWTGFNCDIDENECTDSEDGDYTTVGESCHDDAFCTNTPGSYECACNAGWTGDGITCIDADDCEFSPCAHGGTCYDCGTLCFTCACVVGWRGTTCATDWNECIMGIHQCSDDATCVNNPGSYDCRCDRGYEGTGFGDETWDEPISYQIAGNTVTGIITHGCKNIDDCDPELYQGPTLSPNGPCVMGTCTDDQDIGNQYYCVCEVGYTDTQCQTDINECDPILGDNDCHRFATCKNTVGSYTCTCNEGFDGNGVSTCLDISDCYSQCVNGFCSDLGVGHFKCTCDDGYMDMKCDNDINECSTYTHECARHALCTNNDGSYSCACNTGWSGDGLSQGSGCKDIDDCASNPCDFGECADEGDNAYTCDCQEGFTDFNCDFDVNECYLKTHNCHVDARCVNIPGGFFCRCLSGWEGDGQTCTDLDDCDPDPCDPIHGTCEDRGANMYECVCMPGWTGIMCGDDEDECVEGTHGCDPAATCTNTYGSHECVCKVDFYGDGTLCTPCTTCGAGWKEEGICEEIDLTCVNVDECVEAVDNCDEHSTCVDNEGSFKCNCDQNGAGDEWWGVGIEGECAACTECRLGYHEIEPCTSTTDRICDINVVDGLYIIESEADDNRMCVALMQGEWFPSRINWGNGDEFCGMPGAAEADQRSALLADGQAIWKLTHIGSDQGDNAQADLSYQDTYLIEFNDGDGYRCVFFGDDGKDIYPSLQNCRSYDIATKGDCPWANGGKDMPACGFDSMADLLANGQAIFRVVPLKMNEDKYLIMSASKGRTGLDGEPVWECLAFEEQGAATNPSRYNWGNGDQWCGAGNWEGRGPVVGLLNNKQAVFILTFLQGAGN